MNPSKLMKKNPETIRLPEFMQAVRLVKAAGSAGVVLEQIPTPRPKAGEVLVRVHAAAITRDELDWPVNRLPAIPSYEFSGVVASLGPGVDGFTIGEPVYALSPFNRDGAAAEYMLIPKEFLAHKPTNLDHIHSAAIPLAGLTAWQGLFEHGRLSEGQRVLIHGAAGGVGHFAVQLARWCGAYVIGTASAHSLAAAQTLGLDEVIEVPTVRFEEVLDPVDLVFDTVGGDRLARSASVVRPGGRLVSVASEPPKEPPAARGIEASYFVVEPNGSQLRELTTLAEAGVLQPVIAAVFPLAQARQAFEQSLSAHGAGKIVLDVAI